MTSQQIDLSRQLLALLAPLSRLVAAEVRGEAGDEVTIAQFRVLALLEAGPQTVSTLAKQRQVSLQAMSELAQLLVERGWASRTPDPRDRRQALLALTETGRSHHTRIDARLLAQLEPRLAELSTNERSAALQALPALQRVLTLIAAPAPEAPAARTSDGL